ncbi:NYN domain protein [mine drainage metagenome]|uniref:NYN domain protein n=1 Tax=mine drainage metagenome TaxID=410659 RepID=A0A1J5RWG2_9ZZZZ
MENKLCRIAVFYDGTYFFKVSNYYLYQHERKARLSFKGLHAFIAAEVAKNEGVDARHCQIVDAAYFRGRLSAQQAFDQEKLYSDRIFEDVLMKANVTMFQRHLRTRHDGGFEEKGIDVWLALEAYEMASLKKYDVCVLVTGDGDFVPLVNKLNTLGSRVMLIGWDFSYERDGKTFTTQAATELIDHVNYPIMMDTEIDARERRKDPLIDGIFMEKSATPYPVERMPRVAQNQETSTDTKERRGTILSFAAEKGFGFIKPSGGGENYFFHIRDQIGIEQEEIVEGLKVMFTHGSNDKGLCALKIHKDIP